MNKKFLSAILFGALMATSAGTFVSCKDYDDDIQNLQAQIDTNKTAIAELQKLVGQGKWVSSISSIENGFTVVMSDGSSVQIKGINGKDGVDGKNGTEWTIGEDGFWYMDGEKTANVAVGKDGKNGAVAPSPSISANGNWVVYSWDAEKGEFVANETEVPAAGTASYVVEAAGVYTLHIADENGEYQEIVLPATCDSFVVSSPAKGEVMVSVDVATWGSTGRVKADYDKLVAAFPEIANIKKGDKMTQDGGLPLVVSPSELALDDSFEFALVGMNGKVADIELSNPVEGISNDWSYNYQGIMTRSANAEACLWTLNVTPAYDENKEANHGYAQASNAALVVTNAKGISSRTAFVYSVTANKISGKPTITNYINEVEYSEAIDVLAPIYGAQENTAIFALEKEYFGKFVLEATKKSEVEKYDITIDGSKLMIGNMPENETEITVHLNLIVLGLDGSTATSGTTELKITQPIAAIELPAKQVTLDAKKQEVRWDVKENLALSAVDFVKFYAATPKFIVSREDENGDTQKAYEATIKFYNAKGAEVTFDTTTEKWSNGDAVTFGFDVKADTKGTGATEMWMPETYKVTLIAQQANSTTRLFTAETELEVINPEVAIALVPEFTVDNVLHVVGTASTFADANGVYTITYSLVNGLKYDTNVIKNGFSFKDVDFEEYKEAFDATSAADENIYNAEEMASWNWVNNGNLVVYSYNKEKAETAPAKNDMLGKVRNIEAEFALFGNTANKVKFPFQVLVKSAVYSETPADVVTVDATKLSLHLTDDPATTGEGKNETTVDLAKIVAAKLAYGPKAGALYNLWNTQHVPADTKSKEVTNYNLPELDDTYVIDSKGQAIEFSADDYAYLGFSAAQILELTEDDKFYLTKEGYEYVIVEGTWVEGHFEGYGWNRHWVEGHYEGRVSVMIPGWNQIMAAVNKHYGYKNAVWGRTSEGTIPADEQELINLFNTYSSKAVFNKKQTEYYGVAEVAPSDYLRANSVIKYEDEVGAKFVGISGTNLTARLSAGTVMTAETVEVKMYIEIYDKWGMTMKVPFTVKVSE